MSLQIGEIEMLRLNSLRRLGGLGLSGRGAASVPSIPLPPNSYLGQVATRGFVPNTLETNNATGQMSRSRHRAKKAITNLRVLFPNWYVSGTVETASGAAATYTASIEYPVGTFTRVQWSGANSTTAASGDNTALSGAAVVSIPDDAYFFVRCYRTSTSGALLFYGGHNIDTGNGEGQQQLFTSDQTMGGTVDSYGGWFGPLVIAASTNEPAVLIAGNSRSVGYLDTTYDATSDSGGIARSVGPAYAYSNIGVPGDRVTSFLASNAKRLSILPYFSHVILQDFINDATLPRTTAQMVADTTAFCALMGSKPVYVCTNQPFTTGDYSTVAGQAATGSTVWSDYNTLLRAGISGVAGVIDIASISESGNTRKWVANFTTDGVHENTASAIAVRDSGVVPIASFVLPPGTPVVYPDPTTHASVGPVLNPNAIVATDGAAVQTAVDTSYTQATLANRPLLKSSAPLPNGKAVLTFDGSNDSLSNTGSASVAQTVFVVAQLDATAFTGSSIMVLVGDSGNGGFTFRCEKATMKLQLEAGGSAAIGGASPVAALTAGVYHVFAAGYANPGAWVVYLDGVKVGSGTAAAVLTAARTRVVGRQSSGSYFKGQIAKVVPINAMLTDDEILAYSRFLGVEFGITVA